MQIAAARIDPGRVRSVQKRHQIGKMVWVKVRKDDMLDVILSESQFGEAVGNTAAEIEDDARPVALDQSRGGDSARVELAGSGAEKSEA